MKEIFKKRNRPILVAIAVIFIHLAIFINKFGRTGYSSKIADWSDASNFFNLLVFIIFSLLIYNYNRKRDSENDNFQKALEKPIIGFETVVKGRETWRITNLGKGAALNIRVASIESINTTWENQLVLCYHLTPGQNRELDWLIIPRVIVAIYNDIFGDSFLSLATQDTTHIVPLDRNDTPIGEPPTINGITFNRDEISKIMSLRAARLHAI